jgi:hypothetical protein
MCRNEAFLGHVSKGIRRVSIEPLGYTAARLILGSFFVSPEDIMIADPKMIYSEAQTDCLEELLPSIEALVSLGKCGFILMPQSPFAMTFLDIRALEPNLFRVGNFRVHEWYERWKFARSEFTGTGWLAVKQIPLGDPTLNKSWPEQIELLKAGECVPNAAEMSWFVSTFFKVRSIKLFTTTCLRTASRFSDEQHLHFGHLDGKRLDIGHTSDAYPDDVLGLAILRRF